MKNVVFRVDASFDIGSGHLMRCLTLATSLKAQGASVAFICRALKGNYLRWLEQRGHVVYALPAPISPSSDPDLYLSWLAVDMNTEITQCRAAFEEIGTPDWLVVDHYALDAEWEVAVRPSGSQLLVVDDLANRSHRAELVLDQNYYPDAYDRYCRLVNDADLLLGPRYALLRSEFAEHRSARTGDVRHILVFMGGSDNANATATVLRALSAIGNGERTVDVMLGQANVNRDEIADLCRQQGAQLLIQADDIALRMAQADLSIGATGTATWERACVGLPTIAVSVADNQRPIARHAHEIGILRWLGDVANIDQIEWIKALEWAFTSRASLAQQSERGMQLVDGRGTARVVEKMIENSRRL